MTVLSKKSALVTGAGRGFGLAIARSLARAGASVTLVARTAGEIGQGARDIVADGGTAQVITCDIVDGASVDQAYAAHAKAYGVPDILVNCAGITNPYGSIGEIDVEAWWYTQAVLVRGPLNFMRLALPDMQRAGGGRIINISSIAARMNVPGTSAYTVGKSALIRLSEMAAAEYAADGIYVFSVHPGVVYSKLSEDALTDPAAQKWIPDFLKLLQCVKDQGGNMEGLAICGAKCLALASGYHDELSGKLLDFAQAGIAVEGGVLMA